MYSELNSLRLDSGHAYIDYVKLIELQDLIDKNDYKTMLSNLDRSYNVNMEMLKNEYNNRPGWKKFMEFMRRTLHYDSYDIETHSRIR